MAEQQHKHGEMDITDQEKTFEGFIRWSVIVGLFSLGVIVFLALFAR
ncbi:aa3-type cytochrome c oxidase subunit IV [Roseobacter sp. HKCCD9010]|jgi:hypothetical protein|nr:MULTISPECIES: aa3-type cytochrome c oxidase subunit IV [Rhodobacterales]MBF9048716.1 aa3-type cytochrome c oxidase subunit IV [Rhodobacterales bacterium HKCCD4356]NNV10715.1 aa3-type cytochrome c oxidase subunit IV [Roseobacter sp. HKCCD7357]NNV14900.1 aa3-type cytochrome c oxidase subunit IV [Roseobacter sp. HKCCD8768]NNV24359.1 aa3-type cytochrome c oxidase subunit IV [Roseobacter sp. HKCCD8192]NNV28616.1 aa3-type cytochrome c oxidase subunit IV [Roseobacter sp. HKCCD9061]